MVKPSKSWKEKKELKRQKKQEKALKDKIKAEHEKVEQTAENQEEEEIIHTSVSTISIAVPGSILENAQSAELRTYLAGQIARAGMRIFWTLFK